MRLVRRLFYILILSIFMSSLASANTLQISLSDLAGIQDAVADYFERYYTPGMCQEVADFQARVILDPELSEGKAAAFFYYRCVGSHEWLRGETCEVEKISDDSWQAVYCDN